MNILIVEDEMLAAERLQLLVKQYDPSIQVMACLESIEETVQWLQTKTHPDLLLMDIHLSDGHSFEIFKQVIINKPVIFTTAYDNYAIDAFRHLAIDYILKPITSEALAAGIQKFRTLTNTTSLPDYSVWMEYYKSNPVNRYKDRFLAKVGTRTFFIQADEIAYFYADNKTVYLADREGNRFIINYSIEKLEPQLDPYYFFRINRKMIVHSKMIDVIRPYYNNRLKIALKNLPVTGDMIVSRERAAAFKKWAEG
ncbi:LytTR family DNA-binding domain-containing protein [soil metagenome]